MPLFTVCLSEARHSHLPPRFNLFLFHSGLLPCIMNAAPPPPPPTITFIYIYSPADTLSGSTRSLRRQICVVVAATFAPSFRHSLFLSAAAAFNVTAAVATCRTALHEEEKVHRDFSSDGRRRRRSNKCFFILLRGF